MLGTMAIVQQLVAQLAFELPGEADDFASLVVFLASERSSYITGASIAVDGGFIKGIY
jgi:3-oxoacyl-[acyl-carrier protein] reductase